MDKGIESMDKGIESTDKGIESTDKGRNKEYFLDDLYRTCHHILSFPILESSSDLPSYPLSIPDLT